MKPSSLLLVALVFAADAEGATVGHVPSQFATIQAAIDAPRDTVYVHGDATYEENVHITHPLYLSWAANDPFPGIPRVRSISTASPVNGNVTVRGFHILGGASAAVTAGATCAFDFCRADGGLTCSAPQSYAYVTGCIVFGNLVVSGIFARSLMNTVSGGGMSGGGEATSPFQCNLVIGPAAVGINLGADDFILDNVVRNCTDGIHIFGQTSLGASLNVVEDCSGTGIVGGGVGGSTDAFITNNTVRRCGVSGVVASGVGVTVDGNTVETTGSDGMVLNVTTDHADNNHVTGANGHGITADILVNHMLGNVVTHCTGDGIRVNGSTKIHHNVVGNNGGRGIAVATDYFGNTVLRSNTSYNNGGPGLEISNADAILDSVAFNIGYGNSVGLRRNGVGAIVLTCNDWIVNVSGATSGVPIGLSDVALNPQFCNRPLDIVTLALSSPVLNHPGCGLIGALGQGCVNPVAVDGRNESEALPLRVYPQPSNGIVRFSWPASSQGGRLEIYDAQGALRWSADVAPRASGVTWRQKETSGRTLPPGTYFARLRGRPELGSARVTIVN